MLHYSQVEDTQLKKNYNIADSDIADHAVNCEMSCL